MKLVSVAALYTLVAALSFLSHASAMQPQNSLPTTNPKKPSAPSITPVSDGWDPATSNVTQSPSAEITPTIEFTFARPGVLIPRYTLTLAQTSHGHYRGEQAEPANPSDPEPPTQPFDTNFAISAQTTAKIFTLSAKLKHFNLTCASTAKNIASTGTKTLRYTAPDTTTTSCTYDYSENKEVQSLTEILQAIAETMDQGRHLEFLHRYDRLGLDHAIAALADAASAGQALELTTIAPTLHSIADDPEVIQRVRTRAALLLSTVPNPEPTE